ncbi:hypothetical protein C7378_1807 [Acidipila rosea]|uniref:Uncharacterized protein n=1 Tax=Acidipila rosea TaxID=768535 RepID=A0A4R1L7J4_9BACT|nr:hypothetical protein C7378_1807 [Acidipila rosea]
MQRYELTISKTGLGGLSCDGRKDDSATGEGSARL